MISNCVGIFIEFTPTALFTVFKIAFEETEIITTLITLLIFRSGKALKENIFLYVRKCLLLGG